jgi:hypothetical protein
LTNRESSSTLVRARILLTEIEAAEPGSIGFQRGSANKKEKEEEESDESYIHDSQRGEVSGASVAIFEV